MEREITASATKNELNINVVGGYIKDGFKIYILTE